MAQIDNLNESDFRRLVMDKLEKLGRAAPMNNAAIGRGGIEVYDGGVITITNGGLSVTGTASILGTLQADGTVTFTGTFTQSGETTFTGPTHFDGATDVTGDFDVDGPMTTTGTLDVEGVTTLKNDLNVTTGKVQVGSALTIDPAVDGGGLSFSSGAKLANYSGGIAMTVPGAVLGVSASGVSMGTSAASILTSQSSGIVQVTGQLRLASLPATTQAANVYADADGNLFRKP